MGDSNKGTPDHVHIVLADSNVTNCGTNYISHEDKTVAAAAHEVTNGGLVVTQQDTITHDTFIQDKAMQDTAVQEEATQNNNSYSSEDDVILEDPSSDEEEEEEDKEMKSPNAVVNTVVETMDERAAADSEQVVGPSCLVENKNSFNIISRTSTYNTSSSDSDEDAWDESLLAPPRPKPAAGLYVKADVEKDMQKRKALHDKFNQFISTPLPSATLPYNPGGARGKRGGRCGSQRAGHRGNSGRGFTASMSGRGGAHGRGMLPFPQQALPQQQPLEQQFPQQPFQQLPFPQQLSPQQPFLHQQSPQQPFPRQQSPQQPFPRQQSPQQPLLQQNQRFSIQQPPRQQYPQQRSPQKQFTQQSILNQPPPPPPNHSVQCSPPQSSTLQRLPQQKHPQPQYHSQPWQPPKLKSIFTNECPSKSITPQTAAVTDLSQLDEKGMKNEYEWQRWTIERAVKRALDGLTEDRVPTFISQLQKILSGKFVF